MSKEITRMIFETWMEQYHPGYYLGWGIVMFAETGLFIFGLGAMFFATWGFKVLLLAVGLAAVTWLSMKAHMNICTSDFESGEYPLKRNQ